MTDWDTQVKQVMGSRISTFRRLGVATHTHTKDKSAWKKFLSTQAWVRCRATFLNRNPACVLCMQRDELIPATEVHHTKGQDMEHAFDEDTFQALCKSCHSRITLRDMRNKS